VLKHGGGGELIVRATIDPIQAAVEVMALDRGPGMNAALCLADGYSTTGTPGLGLGAVRRASALFDVYSQPQKGTALVSRVMPGAGSDRTRVRPDPSATSPFDIAGVCIPRRGETECGDGWAFKATSTGGLIVVVDGLGHGPQAAMAARAALDAVEKAPAALNLVELMTRVHEALRPTRGAAVAIAAINRVEQKLRFCGLGNISGVIVAPAGTKHLVSHNGTAGHELRRLQEFVQPWPVEAMLLLHSDGIATHWRLDDYPGLAARSPALIAGVLYRDFNRGRDDATVAVVRGQ
jgi:hypothetical protein